LSISLWAQYVLDNFATVAEAVDALKPEPFRIVAPVLPNGKGAQLHLAISDETGDSVSSSISTASSSSITASNIG
jgi:choloylglycine hydrolase